MKTLKKNTKNPLVLTAMLILLVTAGMFAQTAKVIEMEGHDTMKFSKENITASPGQKITVKLTTVSKFPAAAMSHNFVLLQQSADAKAVATASAKFNDQAYIAPDMKDKIIAHTAMASNGETVEVTFTAPKEPGEYEYICTFPGHFMAGMKGILTVK